LQHYQASELRRLAERPGIDDALDRALGALVLSNTLDWWWADRIAGLIVAGAAAAEAWHTAPKRQSSP